MSTIDGFSDPYAYSYSSDEPAPGSDNPVENAGDQQPAPQQSSKPQEDTSASDWQKGVLARIDSNITAGNYENTGPYSSTVYNGAHNNPNNSED